MIEEWKPIIGYEQFYEVSNLGRVRSLPRLVKNKHSFRMTKFAILKPGIGNSGYYFVNLSVNGISKCKDVHRALALEFFGHHNKHLTVNHKDGNKLNNHIDNLEFISQYENNRHKIDVLGKRGGYDVSGKNNPMWGKKHSQETLKKLRIPKTEEHKLKLSIAKKKFYENKNCSNLRSL